jgi:cytoskeletal protein RodZ
MAKQVGQALREARLARGIDLTEVERVTKIRVKFLRAMEEDRWDELPAPAYARSFLQTYARYLDLDDEPLVEQYGKDIEPKQRQGPIPSGVIHPGTLEPRRSLRPLVLVLGGLAAVVAVVLVVAAIGSIGGSGNGGGNEHPQRHQPPSTTADTTPSSTTTTPGSELSVQLTPTADVWVFLMDDRGRALVDGETLAADQVRGPFTASGFEVTLGNGSVEMTVNGEPAQIPHVASPLGYRITSSGVSKLDPASEPTCL